jgi:alanine dehydrogenase
MHPLHIIYLNGPDIERLSLSDADILDAVEAGLDAQGRKQVVIEPRVHLVPTDSSLGHFNVLRGVVHPLGLAGVKVVGDFVHNHELGLPSEIGMLTLFDPVTGAPLAILNATSITDMRTGAMTALGAKYLARKGSKVLGHIGARGTSYWNIRLLSHYFDFEEIRVHSKRPASREALAARLSKDLGRAVTAVDSWEKCVRGADIVVEATRLSAPKPLL